MCEEKVLYSDFVPFRVGEEVCDFELTTYDPEEAKFSSFKLADAKLNKKWTLLFFYPADFTFVCPTELADIAEKYDDLKEKNVELVSVSTDTQFVHLAWKQNEKLLENVNYPMGTDPTGKVSRMFGVYDEETGLALRGAFLINPDGKLVMSEVNFYNVGRNADEIVRKVDACIYVNKHPEEVCPAKWSVGAKTLKPSEAMVGKVFESV